MKRETFAFLQGRRAGILDEDTFYKTAVLLPLVDYQGQTCILFEVRSNQLKQQPGEICFPGGRMEDSDPYPGEAAVRETCEELNLSRDCIDLIAPLDILVSPFNVLVYPFVGFIKSSGHIIPNYSEVEEIFYVPLDFFLENEPIYKMLGLKFEVPSDYPFELIPQGKDYPFRSGYYPQHFYLWQDYTIWGLTARILNHFVQLVKRERVR